MSEKKIEKEPTGSFVSEKDIPEEMKEEATKQQVSIETVLLGAISKQLQAIGADVKRIADALEASNELYKNRLGIVAQETAKAVGQAVKEEIKSTPASPTKIETPTEPEKKEISKEPQKVEPPIEPTSSSSYVEVAKALFDPYLKTLLSFDQQATDVVIKPTKYLGTENFAKIASIVRDAGGEYVSAGKDSCFKIPNEKLKVEAKGEGNTTVQEIMELFKEFQDILNIVEEGEWIIVKPRQYLGAENFAKIASLTRQANGEYVSAGKESHFRFKKKA